MAFKSTYNAKRTKTTASSSRPSHYDEMQNSCCKDCIYFQVLTNRSYGTSDYYCKNNDVSTSPYRSACWHFQKRR